MQAAASLLCLWPGLPQLWFRGELRAFLTAVVFATLFNFFLVASLVWPELVPPLILKAGWLGLTCFWAVAVWRSYRSFPESPVGEAAECLDSMYVAAQHEYLQGHWFEAESLLQQLISKHDGDIDAKLMLAAVMRQTKRIDDAQQQLKLVERMEGSAKWTFEIRRERILLDRIDPEDIHSTNLREREGKPEIETKDASRANTRTDAAEC